MNDMENAIRNLRNQIDLLEDEILVCDWKTTEQQDVFLSIQEMLRDTLEDIEAFREGA